MNRTPRATHRTSDHQLVANEREVIQNASRLEMLRSLRIIVVAVITDDDVWVLDQRLDEPAPAGSLSAGADQRETVLAFMAPSIFSWLSQVVGVWDSATSLRLASAERRISTAINPVLAPAKVANQRFHWRAAEGLSLVVGERLSQ